MTVEELRENVRESNEAGEGCIPYPQCVEMIESTREQARAHQEGQDSPGGTGATQTMQLSSEPTLQATVDKMEVTTMVVIAVVIIYHAAILLIVAGILSGINKLNKQVEGLTSGSHKYQGRHSQTPGVVDSGRD